MTRSTSPQRLEDNWSDQYLFQNSEQSLCEDSPIMNHGFLLKSWFGVAMIDPSGSEIFRLFFLPLFWITEHSGVILSGLGSDRPNGTSRNINNSATRILCSVMQKRHQTSLLLVDHNRILAWLQLWIMFIENMFTIIAQIHSTSFNHGSTWFHFTVLHSLPFNGYLLSVISLTLVSIC